MSHPVGTVEALKALIRAVITALEGAERFPKTLTHLRRALAALKEEGR